MKNIIIVILVVVLVGGVIWFLSTLTSKEPTLPEEETTEEAEVPEEKIVDEETELPGAVIPPNSVANDTICDNYDCLISAASQCQSISATVSYSEIPNLLFPFPDFSISGQTEYEIKKSSGVNDCILNFSPVLSIISISEEGRENLLAQGITDNQINADLQTMNKNLELAAEEQTICPSNAAIITAFLTDEKKLTTLTNFTNFEEEMGSYDVKVHIEGSLFSSSKSKTVTYTLSSGQELVCTVTMPLQPANTSVTISHEECTNQGGYVAQINNDGTACPKIYTDLGTIVDGTKMNNKYPQCCVVK